MLGKKRGSALERKMMIVVFKKAISSLKQYKQLLFLLIAIVLSIVVLDVFDIGGYKIPKVGYFSFLLLLLFFVLCRSYNKEYSQGDDLVEAEQYAMVRYSINDLNEKYDSLIKSNKWHVWRLF